MFWPAMVIRYNDFFGWPSKIQVLWPTPLNNKLFKPLSSNYYKCIVASGEWPEPNSLKKTGLRPNSHDFAKGKALIMMVQSCNPGQV